MLEFRLLGPIEIRAAGQLVDAGPPRQRSVLAALAVDAGRPVMTETIIDRVWGDTPPDRVRHALYVYIARIRQVIGRAGAIDGTASLLTRRSRGYLLDVDSDCVDMNRFGNLTGQADDPRCPDTKRVALLREALDLWRGEPLADLSGDWAAVVRQRWQRQHLDTVVSWARAELRLGRATAIIDPLAELIVEYPLVEPLAAALMRAYHATGRIADALGCYATARHCLVEQLGIDPGPELRQLHLLILRSSLDPGLPAPSPAEHGPAQLLPDVQGFTGRATELEWLDTILATAGERSAGAVIAAISGTAGVGKTALAVHWSHQVADRFPDGQLYVNLRGYASGPPMRAIAALSWFLRSLGVPAEQVPVDPDEAAAKYRSTLADRRVLILLDNANHPDQVRPLLPGRGGCVVLATSREHLAGLVARDGAHRLTLDLLPPDDAHALLARILGRGQAAAEPEATVEMARLCGHLPLALRIAAANLTSRPHDTIASYVTVLRTSDRLATLQVDGDEHAAVRVAFDLSYAAQPPAVRRMFRLLGLVPGADLTVQAAAALAGTNPTETERLMSRLACVHLIDQHSTGRYTLHDLMRLYAADRAQAEEPEPECQAGFRRLLTYYFRTADAAARVVSPQVIRLPGACGLGPDVDPHPVPDHAAAMAWLEAERANLVAAIVHAARNGPRWAAWYLCDTLRGYFYLRMHIIDWLTAGRAALAAARVDGDLNGQAAAHNALGNAHWRHSRHTTAVRHFTRALALARQSGWQECQASVLANRSAIHRLSGHLRRAVADLTEALVLNRRSGSLQGQGVNHGSFGSVYAELGELERAARHSRKAIAIYREIGSASGEAIALTNLGELVHFLGNSQDALSRLEEALAAHRRLGNWNTEAETLRILASVHRDLGQPRRALELASAAIGLTGQSSYRRLRADIVNTAGTIQLCLGRATNAIDHHQQAALLSGRDLYPRAGALIGLTRAHAHLGQAETALHHARQALELTRGVGYRLLEGFALAALAEALFANSDSVAGDATARQAVDVFHDTGYALGLPQNHHVPSGRREGSGHSR